MSRWAKEAHAAEPQRDREEEEGQDEHVHQRTGHHDPNLHEHVKVRNTLDTLFTTDFYGLNRWSIAIAIACGLHLISRVTTSFGLRGQL